MNKRKINFFVLLLNVSYLFAGNTVYNWHNEAMSIIDKMTVDEKISQSMNDSKGIERLGILPYNWWNEALHGVARNGKATVFPQPINMACTFNPELVFNIASAISDEARAKFNKAQDMKVYGIYAGLTFWSPNVNIFRDPRWGRGMETYGEDPYLTGEMGKAFVNGLQGDNAKYLKAAACAKHYAVHSGPEALRHEFDAVVSDKDLYETYLPAFEKLVKEANVEAVMGAYNRVNGFSASAHPRLLIDILRKDWGFKGHVVSDCGAVTDIFQNHKIVDTEAEAAAQALKNGLNLECGSSFNSLREAYDRGLIGDSDLNKALLPLVITKLKLGLIGDSQDNPYNDISGDVVCSKQHTELALKAAEQSMVLLKNEGVLPVLDKSKSLYLTGPFATDANVLLGNYYGIPSRVVTYLQGISDAVGIGTKINYKPGILATSKNRNPIDSTTGEAKGSDITIVFLGESNWTEGEECDAIASESKGDRPDLSLPGHQIEFLRKIRENNKNKIITVVSCGSPFETNEICELSDAVIWSGYPGQEAGVALANILFGKVSPSGRLPITFPESEDVLPDFKDYSMKGRTYRYQEEGIAYPFGYGLTYSTVNYGKPLVEGMSRIGKKEVKVSFAVKNTGKYIVEDIPQLYISTPGAGVDMPLNTLIGFKRIKLHPGESQEVEFTVSPQMLQMIDKKGKKVLLKGNYRLILSGCAPGKRSDELGVQKHVVEFKL